MEKIKVGDTLSLEVVNHKSFPGAINITNEGREVEDVYSVSIHMVSSGHPEIIMSSYIKDENGKYTADVEDGPDGIEFIPRSIDRKFLFSGKLEIKVDEEI